MEFRPRQQNTGKRSRVVRPWAKFFVSQATEFRASPNLSYSGCKIVNSRNTFPHATQPKRGSNGPAKMRARGANGD